VAWVGKWMKKSHRCHSDGKRDLKSGIIERGEKQMKKKNMTENSQTVQNKKKEDATREDAYLYWLYTLEGIGKKKREMLLNMTGSAGEVYEMQDDLIDKLAFLNAGDKQAIKNARQNQDVLERYTDLEKQNIRFIMPHHRDYPERLAHIPDAPFGLFVRGHLPDENAPSVAVIGARECSEYGRYMAAELGRSLSHAGIQVVSGLARGIDGIAQSAAAQVDGQVFGVLGCGVDICYPKENERLYDWLVQKGGLISEYKPGTLPKAGLFPRRNRIISGLADAIVVVEAREKSGTLITVDMALEQGRDVYVIPGRVTDPLSRGCNKLIRQGAGVLTGSNDLIGEIDRSFRVKKGQGANLSEQNQSAAADKAIPCADMPEQADGDSSELCRAITRLLYLEPMTLQRLYNGLSDSQPLEMTSLIETLFYMEKQNLIRLCDGYYTLKNEGWNLS